MFDSEQSMKRVTGILQSSSNAELRHVQKEAVDNQMYAVADYGLGVLFMGVGSLVGALGRSRKVQGVGLGVAVAGAGVAAYSADCLMYAWRVDEIAGALLRRRYNQIRQSLFDVAGKEWDGGEASR